MLQIETAGGSTVLAFRPVPRARRDADPSPERGTVLLFTGVRYERWVEPSPADADAEPEDVLQDSA